MPNKLRHEGHEVRTVTVSALDINAFLADRGDLRDGERVIGCYVLREPDSGKLRIRINLARDTAPKSTKETQP